MSTQVQRESSKGKVKEVIVIDDSDDDDIEFMEGSLADIL